MTTVDPRHPYERAVAFAEEAVKLHQAEYDAAVEANDNARAALVPGEDARIMEIRRLRERQAAARRQLTKAELKLVKARLSLKYAKRTLAEIADSNARGEREIEGVSIHSINRPRQDAIDIHAAWERNLRRAIDALEAMPQDLSDFKQLCDDAEWEATGPQMKGIFKLQLDEANDIRHRLIELRDSLAHRVHPPPHETWS